MSTMPLFWLCGRLKVDRQNLLKAAHGDSPLEKLKNKFRNQDYGTIHSLKLEIRLCVWEADLFYRFIMAVYFINLVKVESDFELSTALLRLLQSYPCNKTQMKFQETVVQPPSYPAVLFVLILVQSVLESFLFQVS